MERFGRLEKSEEWGGDVLVSGDLVVPEGVALRLLPGTRVSFARRPRWACAVFRNAPEGYPIEASQRELCDIVVLGKIEARGTAESEILLGGGDAPWGGILFLGEGRGAFRRAAIKGAAESAVQTFDESSASFEDCDLDSTVWGLLARGLSRVSVSGGSIRGGEVGLLTTQGARAEVRGTALWGKGAIACEDSSLVSAEGARLERASDYALLAKHRSWARLSACGSAARDGRIIKEREARVDA